MKKYQRFIETNNLGEIDLNCSFRNLTTLGVGGNISMVYYPNSLENFACFYQYYLEEQSCSLFVIGNGSNIFASDDNFKGIVVSFKKIVFSFHIINDQVKVSSGYMMNSLIKQLAKRDYGGLDFLYGIPGTIGGMVVMNAGAYHFSISDVFISATCLDKSGIIKTYTKEEMKFQYRKSIAQELIVLDATFKIIKQSSEITRKTMQTISLDRHNKQPLRNKNAGSTFKNILPYSAWKMIDSVGLRGMAINDAQISNKHSNFVINRGQATSKDLEELIKLIQQEVAKKYGIILENEWIKVNF